MSAHPLPRTTDAHDYFDTLLSRADEIRDAYRAATPRSAELHRDAHRIFPGGYTRDAVIRDPHPTYVERGAGTTLVDADGRRLTDFWFNATSLPLGHADPAITSVLAERIARGTAFFAPTEDERALAELLLERLPSAQRIRFANSGSEAVMMAVRFARAFRERPLIVKFEGSYHGSYDDVSWSVSPDPARAGRRDAPTPIAETAGLSAIDDRVAVLPFNDADTLRRFVTANHDRIAALLVEPLANRIGLLPPDPAFLAEARALCDRFGIVLIFDEVIAFRVGYHGAQGLMGVRPDLTTLGKIIGGGFPVGAVAGRADILDLSRPGHARRVTHAGTFNANPVTMVAGFHTMSRLTPAAFDALAARGAALRTRLASSLRGLPLQVTGAGSLFKITATDRPIRDYRDAATADKRWETVASLALLTAGFMMTPNLAGCVSTATTDTDVDRLARAIEAIAVDGALP